MTATFKYMVQQWHKKQKIQENGGNLYIAWQKLSVNALKLWADLGVRLNSVI